eukprot:1153482-Pelagomonas_calceolata.AAC.1
MQVARSNSRYLLRSTGGRGGNREHSAPATATPPTSEARHPSQLHPEHRHFHLVEVKYCEDTRPKNQLKASKQQHCNLCCHHSRASAQVTLHTILLATRLARKLHAHSVQYAFKLGVLLRRLLSTLISKIRHGLLMVTLQILIDVFSFVTLGEGDTRCLGPRFTTGAQSFFLLCRCCWIYFGLAKASKNGRPTNLAEGNPSWLPVKPLWLGNGIVQH